MREENRARLNPDDIIFAVHPGSGTSWIGSLLICLGIHYVSGHHEALVNDRDQQTGGWIDDPRPLLPGTARPLLPLAEMVRHNPILHGRDQRNPDYREPLRVIQTNDSPQRFTRPLAQKVVLLVRDGRDTVLSLYHWFQSFTDFDLSLEDYLSGNNGAWPPPAQSWAFFNFSWLKAVAEERLHLVGFEGCRADPIGVTRGLLAFLGIRRSDDEIRAALEESSYASMRKMEDRLEGEQRVMRKGQVGEWRERFDGSMLATFNGLPAQALKRFGYEK